MSSSSSSSLLPVWSGDCVWLGDVGRQGSKKVIVLTCVCKLSKLGLFTRTQEWDIYVAGRNVQILPGPSLSVIRPRSELSEGPTFPPWPCVDLWIVDPPGVFIDCCSEAGWHAGLIWPRAAFRTSRGIPSSGGLMMIVGIEIWCWVSVSVHRLRGGGMFSPQPVTTLGRRWRPGREGRGSALAGRVPGRWFSIRTPRVSASRYATSSFTLQSPLCTPTSRWVLQVFIRHRNGDKIMLFSLILSFCPFFNFKFLHCTWFPFHSSWYLKGFWRPLISLTEPRRELIFSLGIKSWSSVSLSWVKWTQTNGELIRHDRLNKRIPSMAYYGREQPNKDVQGVNKHLLTLPERLLSKLLIVSHFTGLVFRPWWIHARSGVLERASMWAKWLFSPLRCGGKRLQMWIWGIRRLGWVEPAETRLLLLFHHPTVQQLHLGTQIEWVLLS